MDYMDPDVRGPPEDHYTKSLTHSFDTLVLIYGSAFRSVTLAKGMCIMWLKKVMPIISIPGYPFRFYPNP